MDDRLEMVRIGTVVRPSHGGTPSRRAESHSADGSPDITEADRSKGRDKSPGEVHVRKEYRAGLFELQHYSHVMILWWAHQRATPEDRSRLRVHPRPAPDHLMGVFATRSPARPNPVAVSVCRLLGVDEDAGVLRLDAIDAEDGSPVVDIKPYSPGLDRVRDPRQPAWFSHLSDEFEELDDDAADS